MYFIYKQIEQKGLFFYCLTNGQYKLLNPNLIIGKVYDRYASASKVLYVIYSDRNFSESRVINGIFYVAQIVLVLYVLLYAYNYFTGKSPTLKS
jgi:hypothetical protein